MNFGQDFRAEVLKRPGDTLFRTVGGWRFGLSYGFGWVPTREEFEHVKHGRGSAFAERMGRPAIEQMSYAQYVERMLSAIEALKASGQTDKTWILSASLWPRGRPSTKKDWEYLGKMCAAIGVPEKGALLTPFETTAPTDVHYWRWEEKDV